MRRYENKIGMKRLGSPGVLHGALQPIDVVLLCKLQTHEYNDYRGVYALPSRRQ